MELGRDVERGGRRGTEGERREGREKEGGENRENKLVLIKRTNVDRCEKDPGGKRHCSNAPATTDLEESKGCSFLDRALSRAQSH